MTAQLSPLGVQKFYDNNGNPLAFGQLYTYAAGTTTPQATYVDSTQTTQNTNPIQLNFRGECNLWLDPTLSYKLLLTDAAGNTIPNWPIDNIPGGPFINPTGSITVPVNFIPTPTNTLTLGNSTHSWANLYVGVNDAPVLDTVSGNIGYYARTAAEIAASVTPTNFSYTPAIAIDPRRYGMKADGVTDDSIAFQRALNVASHTAGYVQLPAGSILIGSALGASLTIPVGILVRGCGPQNTKILRGFTGNLISGMSAYASLQDLTIDGQQGTFGAGIGIDVTSGGNQHWRNVEITSFSNPCVRFAADAGSNSIMVGGSCFTTATAGTAAAIQINGTDSAAVPRVFLGVESGGCTLFDFGGCNDLFVNGGYSNGLIFGAASSKVYISNFRIGAAAGSVTIQGSVHQITNVVTAATITIQGSNHNISIEPTTGGGWADITDSSTGSAVFIKQVSYTPSWTSSGGGAAIGNATVKGEWSRTGNTVCADIDILIGSTTNFGTGNLQIGLPLAPVSSGQFIAGNVFLNHASSALTTIAAAINNPALSFFNIQANGTTAAVSGTVPWTWATGDRITLHIQYQVP